MAGQDLAEPSMSKLLRQSPWRVSFLLVSVVARIPLSMTTVVLILAALEAGRTTADAGLLVAAIAIGAAVSGLIQGPAWDRVSAPILMTVLAVLSTTALLLVALDFSGNQPLLLLLTALYGLLRPHVSTVSRSVWLQEFSQQPTVSGQIVAVDISLGPIISIIGPLLAALAFASFGSTGALIIVAAIGLVGQIGTALLVANRGLPWSSTESRPRLRETFAAVFTNPPLVTVLALSFFGAVAAGAVTILFAAALDDFGKLSWLGGILAVNAIGTFAGTFIYRRLSHSPGSFLHWILFAEVLGLSLYGIGFMWSAAALWPIAFIAALVVTPLSAALYMLMENRSYDGNRGASFSLLASVQFAGLSLGQVVFSALATEFGAAAAMFSAAAVMLVTALAWISLPYGMRKYRIQNAVSWWPEDLLQSCQRIDLLPANAQEPAFRRLLKSIENDLERGAVPDFPRTVRSMKREELPPSLDRLGRLAWIEAWSRIKTPGLADGIICGQWMQQNRMAEQSVLRAAIHFGFVYRSFVEDTTDLPTDFSAASHEAQLFATVFHASKLRGSRRYSSLDKWCADSRLPEEIRSDKLLQTLGTLGRWGSSKIGHHDLVQLNSAWAKNGHFGKEMLLNALFIARPFPEQGETLVRLATDLISNDNDDLSDSVELLFQARGYRLIGQFDLALDSLSAAHERLPNNDNTRANDLFVEQFDQERQLIFIAQAQRPAAR